jgi:hypothetical protein
MKTESEIRDKIRELEHDYTMLELIQMGIEGNEVKVLKWVLGEHEKLV